MPGTLKLSVKQAESLAEEMEANGNDTSKIRDAIAEIPSGAKAEKQPSLPKERVPDDVYVQALREQASTQEGKGLICMICKEETNILICDVCEACFRGWALSTRNGD